MSPRTTRIAAAALLLSILGLLAWSLLAPGDQPRTTPPPGRSQQPSSAVTEAAAPEVVATVESSSTAHPAQPTPTPGTFAIEGSVTLDGEPLADVAVRLVPISPPGVDVRVRTDAAGRFHPSLASGEWEVFVEHGRGPRVTPEWPRALVRVGTAQNAVIEMERDDGTVEVLPPSVSVDLFTARDLVGQVVDAGTGRAVPGAIVSVEDRRSCLNQATADADGRFELVLPGPAVRRTRGVSYHVLARAPGYGAGGVQLRRFVASQSVGPDAPLGPLRIALEPGLTLRGVVTDLEGAPVRASVRARATSRDAEVELNWALETALDGTFVLDHVPTGTRSGPLFEGDMPGITLGPAHASVAMAVEAEGFERERVPAAAAGPGAEPTHVRLRANADVDGVVLGPDGAPLAGALVAFSRDLDELVGERFVRRIPRLLAPHPPMGVLCGRAPADGSFRFSTPEGPAWLLVLARGCAPRLVALSPPVTGAVVRLDPSAGSIAGTLQGKVEDPFDERRELFVFACVPGEAAPPTLTLARGDVRVINLATIPGAVVADAQVADDRAFGLDDVPPGAFELRAWAHGRRLSLSDGGLVRPGDAAALSVSPSGRVLIRVQASGSASTFTWVVVPAEGPPREGGGALRRPGEDVAVPPGEARVVAFAKGHAPAATRVTIAAGEVVQAALTLSPGGADLTLEFTYPARPVEALELRWRDPAIDVERVLQLPAVPACTLDGVSVGRFDLRVTVHERVGGAVRARDVVLPLRAPVAGPQVIDLR